MFFHSFFSLFYFLHSFSFITYSVLVFRRNHFIQGSGFFSDCCTTDPVWISFHPHASISAFPWQQNVCCWLDFTFYASLFDEVSLTEYIWQSYAHQLPLLCNSLMLGKQDIIFLIFFCILKSFVRSILLNPLSSSHVLSCFAFFLAFKMLVITQLFAIIASIIYD